MKKINKKGFTIVELVIVIAVIAILAAVLIPTFSNVVSDAKDKAALTNAQKAYKEYLAAKGKDIDDAGTDFIYEDKDNGRWVAIVAGAVEEDNICKAKEDALKKFGTKEVASGEEEVDKYTSVSEVKVDEVTINGLYKPE